MGIKPWCPQPTARRSSGPTGRWAPPQRSGRFSGRAPSHRFRRRSLHGDRSRAGRRQHEREQVHCLYLAQGYLAHRAHSVARKVLTTASRSRIGTNDCPEVARPWSRPSGEDDGRCMGWPALSEGPSSLANSMNDARQRGRAWQATAHVAHATIMDN